MRREDKASGMTRKFDIVVIGTGSAASAVASRCRSAGWQVAVGDATPKRFLSVLRKPLTGSAE